MYGACTVPVWCQYDASTELLQCRYGASTVPVRCWYGASTALVRCPPVLPPAARALCGSNLCNPDP
eukprot:121872-Chlamydomonas_euryale.AAC.5